MKKILLFSLLFLYPFLFLHAEGPSYIKALKLYLDGSYEESILVIRELIDKEGRSFDAHYLAGHNYWKLGNLQTTVAHFKNALSFEPNEENVYIDLVKVYACSYKWKDAEAVSSEALEKFPDSVELKSVYAAILLKQKRTKEALEIIEKLKALNPNDYRPLSIESRIYYEMGKYEKAETSLKWAITIAPKNPYLKNNLSVVYEKIAQEYKKNGQHEMAKNSLVSADKNIKEAISISEDPIFLENSRRIHKKLDEL
ncbi:MAG: tetratricopeptide repeat protein [Leptospiraceae bacterium]|nr:tetratricopeptide repeat protein [Leptospiraceae bacterium]